MRHDTKGIVLMIQVKKPGVEVFESHEVGGQVYYYLVGSLLSGVSTPYAVLSSYDEMCIAYLDKDNGASRDILKRNAAKLGEDIDAPMLEAFDICKQSPCSPPSSHKKMPEKPSPESTLKRVFDENHKVDHDEPWDRAVTYTQTFGRGDANEGSCSCSPLGA